MTEEGTPKLTEQEQKDIARILSEQTHPINYAQKIDALTSELAEQKKINSANTELLVEIAQGLKAMREGNAGEFLESRRVTPEKLKGFVKGPAPSEKGKIVGCCRECGCTVRVIPAGPHHINLCAQCGVVLDDGVLYGTPCADCPHPEGGHPGGGRCTVEIGMDAGEPDLCECLGFVPRRTAQTEKEERIALKSWLSSAEKVDDEALETIAATLPNVVVYRAFHEWLDAAKEDPPTDLTRVRVVGRHLARAHAALRAESEDINLRKRIAERAATAPEEHTLYTTKIGELLAGGMEKNHPEILELTRKAGDAWNRMSSAEKKAAKAFEAKAREFVEKGGMIHAALEQILGPPDHDPGCDVNDIDPAIGRPTKPCNCKGRMTRASLLAAAAEGDEHVEKLPPLDPKRMRAVVLKNQDEERAELRVTFLVTRSQALTLQWGLDHPESMGAKPGDYKTVEDLAANMLAPSLNYMLKHIAISRAKTTPGGPVFVPERMKLPEGKVPVTDGQGGPVVGAATTRRDKQGNVVADIEVTDPEMQKKIAAAIDPGKGGFSIGSHVKKPGESMAVFRPDGPPVIVGPVEKGPVNKPAPIETFVDETKPGPGKDA